MRVCRSKPACILIETKQVSLPQIHFCTLAKLQYVTQLYLFICQIYLIKEENAVAPYKYERVSSFFCLLCPRSSVLAHFIIHNVIDKLMHRLINCCTLGRKKGHVPTGGIWKNGGCCSDVITGLAFSFFLFFGTFILSA